MNLAVRILRGSLLRTWRRTAAAVAATFIPAALVAAVGNFVLDARAKVSHELRRRGPNLVVANAGAVPVDELRSSVHGIRVATPLASGIWAVDGREIPLFGFDPAEAKKLREGWRVEGSWPRDGVMVGAGLAERFGLAPGDLFGGLAVEGVAETGEAEDDAAFSSLPLALALARGAAVDRIELSVEGTIAGVEAAARAIESRWPSAEARVQRRLAEAEAAILDRLTAAFGIVLALVLAVSALATTTSLAATVPARRREFGILRALGARDGRIVRLLAAEAVALLLAGLLPGAACGLLLSGWLGKAVFGEAVSPHPAAVAASALACAAVAALGAIVPVRRALAVEPARVLKEE